MLDCQSNTAKKASRCSSRTASFTPKHRILMLELPVLNSGMFLNHSAGDVIIYCWCKCIPCVLSFLGFYPG